jgi:hypothetical protein
MTSGWRRRHCNHSSLVGTRCLETCQSCSHCLAPLQSHRRPVRPAAAGCWHPPSPPGSLRSQLRRRCSHTTRAAAAAQSAQPQRCPMPCCRPFGSPLHHPPHRRCLCSAWACRGRTRAHGCAAAARLRRCAASLLRQPSHRAPVWWPRLSRGCWSAARRSLLQSPRCDAEREGHHHLQRRCGRAGGARRCCRR